jgi:hypothetical protein
MKAVKKIFKLLGIMAVLLTIPLAAYITTSKGVDYVHGFGKACAVIHDGWSFHGQCGVQVPPSP